MSKNETWRTRKYWESVGGLLVEEFMAIQRNENNGQRLIDGVIVLGEKTAIHDSNFFDIENHDVIVVQTKASRLGMYLMGQAFFSREILKRYKPRSIKTVAICAKGDYEMEKICKQFDIEVVVIPNTQYVYFR